MMRKLCLLFLPLAFPALSQIVPPQTAPPATSAAPGGAAANPAQAQQTATEDIVKHVDDLMWHV